MLTRVFGLRIYPLSRTLILTVLLVLAGCVSVPPKQPDDLCAIFLEKPRWYKAAKQASERWQAPIPVLMAIIYQESRFQARVRPPRKRFLWIFPGSRPSSAYGYSQATNGAWADYQKATNRRNASRSSFADAVDFVGWYNAMSHRRNGIPRTNTYRLYLAYHEGHGGYKRASYQRKKWLLGVARKVANRAAHYQRQYAGCKQRLNRSRSWFGWL
jgi:hypothetical protein